MKYMSYAGALARVNILKTHGIWPGIKTHRSKDRKKILYFTLTHDDPGITGRKTSRRLDRAS